MTSGPRRVEPLAAGFRSLAAARRMLGHGKASIPTDVGMARSRLARFLSGYAPKPSGSTVNRSGDQVEIIPQVRPQVRPDRPPVVFVHGGGFVYHDVDTFLPLLDHIAAATGRRIIAPCYSKAPETDPADFVPGLVRAVSERVRALAAEGPVPTLVGDSIGAMVVLAAAHDILGDPAVPILLLQPMLDLHRTEPSDAEEGGDAETEAGLFLDRTHIAWFSRLARAGFPSGFDPLAFGPEAFARLGRIVILTPTCDFLAEDSRRFAGTAPEGRVLLNTLAGLPHDGLLYAGKIPEAFDALGDVVAILQSH